jgi:2-hydroxychromene-2-carboxylate isomerase
MTFTSKLKGAAIGALLGKTGDKAFQAFDLAKQRLARTPKRLDFYFDVADPWSYLAAQATLRLCRAYPVELGVHIVTPPASDVDSSPELRRKHALRDARDVAAHLDLDFGGKDADGGSIKRAGQVLVRERAPMAQLEAAIAVGAALWSGDQKQLTLLMGQLGHEAQGSVAPALNASYMLLRKAGFYQAASWHWDGEWYGGIDRVPYLEAALANATADAPPPVLARRAPLAPERIAGVAERPVVDFWFSFRSPYSYLALERVAELAARHPIDLRVRPVLPLEARGAQMVRQKKLYLVRDAKREADRLSIPFGAISDPHIKGAEHAIAVAHAIATSGGDVLGFARSAMRGAWAEARDLTSYVDLRAVVERAGVDWAIAKDALAGDAWRAWCQAAAADLAVAGLWGVPSFKVGDYATWGQDRIDYLDDRLRRHFAAPAPAPTATATGDSA